jgi:hypothetical protein
MATPDALDAHGQPWAMHGLATAAATRPAGVPCLGSNTKRRRCCAVRGCPPLACPSCRRSAELCRPRSTLHAGGGGGGGGWRTTCGVRTVLCTVHYHSTPAACNAVCPAETADRASRGTSSSTSTSTMPCNTNCPPPHLARLKEARAAWLLLTPQENVECKGATCFKHGADHHHHSKHASSDVQPTRCPSCWPLHAARRRIARVQLLSMSNAASADLHQEQIDA